MALTNVCPWDTEGWCGRGGFLSPPQPGSRCPHSKTKDPALLTAVASCGHDPLNIPPQPWQMPGRAGTRYSPSPCPCSLATSPPGGLARTREALWDLGPGGPVCSQPAGKVLKLQELSAGLLASLSHRCSSEEQQTKTKLFCVCKLSPETGVWQP